MDKNSLIVALARRDMVGRARRRRLEAAEVLLQISQVGEVVRRLEVVGDGVKVDPVLRQQGLIFPEAVDEIALVGLLLPAPGRLWRDDAALDLGLDAVGAWLLLVATDFSLLAQDARVAARQLHRRRFGHGGPRRRRRRRRFGKRLFGCHGIRGLRL